MSDYICGMCRYWDSDFMYCWKDERHYAEEQDTCDDWTDNNEVELTDEEKDAIKGDIEMHRKFVEGEETE